MNARKKELMLAALQVLFSFEEDHDIQRQDLSQRVYKLVAGSADRPVDRLEIAQQERQIWNEVFWDLFIAKIITPHFLADVPGSRFRLHSEAQAHREKLEREINQPIP